MKTGKNTAFFNSLSPGGERDYTDKLVNLTHMSSSISAGFNYKI